MPTNAKNTCEMTVASTGDRCENKAKEQVGDISVCGVHRRKAIALNLASVVEPSISNQKGTKMDKFIHCLQTRDGQDQVPAPRLITNMGSEFLIKAVQESDKINGRPVAIKNIDGVETDQSVMSLSTGTYHFPLLERAARNGVKFRVGCFDHAYLSYVGEEKVAEMESRANFVWANATTTFMISFDGVTEWGLEPLGLKVTNDKKLTKRLNEVLRLTACSYEGHISMREFKTPKGHSDRYYDGINAMSEEFARKIGFDKVRGNGRLLCELGLIKGDFIIIPGLDVDVLYHTENMKTKGIRTTGWTMFTIENHEPHHMLRHDDQTRGNFPFFLTEEIVCGDLQAMVADYRKSVATGGDLFNYMEDASQYWDNPLPLDLNEVQLSTTLEAQSEMLKKVGLAPATFANIPFMRLEAQSRKMNANRVKKTSAHKRLFIPARNAFLGAVTTWEACTQMMGMEFPGHDGTRTFFDHRVGLVIPGARFHDTYDLHGGHDEDDTWSMFLIRVFCSDDARLSNLHRDHVVDPNLVFGKTEDTATYAALAIRRPNGPGEYSIEACDGIDMPWMLFNEDSIGTFDLAEAPMSQFEVYEDVKTTGIPTSVTYDKDYGPEEAMLAVQAQMINPQVGPFANVLMCWAQAFTDGRMPVEMIGKMEDVVDCLQQTADALSFTIISEAVKDMWIEFRDTVMAEEVKVDPILLATRIPKAILVGEEKVLIGTAIMKAGLTEAGSNTRTQVLYNQAIKDLQELAKKVAQATRNTLPMAQNVRSMVFGSEMKTFVQGWLRTMNGRLKAMGNDYRENTPEGANAILRRKIQIEQRIALEEFMDSAVQTLVENENIDEHKAVLAMYKWITTPRFGEIINGKSYDFAHGDIDRILIQPSSKGKTSMLQLFIEAAAMEGFLDDDDVDESFDIIDSLINKG